MAGYERALQQLYQASVAEFVAERKRRAAELRAAGDAVGATELAKSHRPSISAWTVNQLYWHARDAFDDMLAAAARLRKGDMGAAGDYRETLANLRQRAAAILKDAGHTASDATLRRVSGTLAAIAAEGGFAGPPGTLAADLEPPGFEAVGAPAKRATSESHPAIARRREDVRARATAERKRLEAAKAEERAEQKRLKAEEARRKDERQRIEARLRAARADLTTSERDVSSLRKKLGAAEEAVADARRAVQDLERELADLD